MEGGKAVQESMAVRAPKVGRGYLLQVEGQWPCTEFQTQKGEQGRGTGTQHSLRLSGDSVGEEAVWCK